MGDLRLGFGNSGNEAEASKVAPVEIIIEEQDDFEFAFSIESDPGAFSDVSADEIFYNGRILPIYPLFNRDLIAGVGTHGEEQDKFAERVGRLALECDTRDLRLGSESSSSSISPEEEDLERHRRAASDNLVWESKSAPQSPNRWRKSSSTGSSAPGSRKWKLRDLVVGRSRSDGKDRLVVIPPSELKEKKCLRSLYSIAKSSEAEKKEKKEKSEKKEKKERSGKGKGEAAKEMDIVTAHRIYYGRVNSGVGQLAVASAGSSRRSFLPYRQELLGGIFGNTKHNLF